MLSSKRWIRYTSTRTSDKKNVTVNAFATDQLPAVKARKAKIEKKEHERREL